MGWSCASALVFGWANGQGGTLAAVGVGVVCGLGSFLSAAFLSGLLESAVGGPRRSWPAAWVLVQVAASALSAQAHPESLGWMIALGGGLALLGAVHLAMPVATLGAAVPEGAARPQGAPAAEAPRSAIERRADTLLADLRAVLGRVQDADALVDLPRLRVEVEASARQVEQALAHLRQLEAAPEGEALAALRAQALARAEALLSACRACRDALLAHEAARQRGDAAALSDGTARVQQATVALVELAPKA